ncbi:MAG: YceI family protein [Streptosporangiaceae bacterium]
MPRFRIDAGESRVWIEAKSSLHPIHGEGSGLDGTIEAELSDGRFDLSTGPVMRLSMPVERLQSGNRLYDGEMRRRVDTRKYPTISGEATDVREAGEAGRYHVRGDLSFHGVTNAVEGDVELSAPDERTLVVEGERVFDIREFRLDPPKILTLRVYPEVNVRVRVVARRES